ncbi:MAG: FtsQ-type POTRA domain-containing protein [Clostridia bacterium]|nr:FtsQ-type POTRA domain-containing protein [Clostridia bacterium]
MQSEVNKRRAQRQKQARKRQLKAAFIIFIIIALIALVVMCFTIFFNIKHISTSGSKIYSKAEIYDAAGITKDDNLLVISEKEIENRIRKKLPYVDSVKIKRNLPDKIILTITDAKEYAYFTSGKSNFILSENGYILKEQPKTPKNVFEIITSGIEGSVGEKAVYKNSAEEKLIGELITTLRQKQVNIDKIDVTSMLQIKIFVDNRFEVIIGDSKYITEKIAHLSSMIESISNRKGKIDLSMWTPQKSQGSFVEQKE